MTTGTVASVKGTFIVQRDGQDIELKQNDVLKEGDIIVGQDVDGQMDILLNSNSVAGGGTLFR